MMMMSYNKTVNGVLLGLEVVSRTIRLFKSEIQQNNFNSPNIQQVFSLA